MTILRIIILIISIILLTILTQIGGLVLIITLLFSKIINRLFSKKWKQIAAKFLLFLSLYSIATFLIVPPLAKLGGRVPLPLYQQEQLKPANILTCFLNRHYVKKEMKAAIHSTAQSLNREFPGTEVNYLDASFPFINHFPLFPHLSHNDGEKLDLSFLYKDSQTGESTNEVPSYTGYGICEEPKAGEENMPEYCRQKGYWQYNLIEKITPQYNKSAFDFDETRTERLIQILINQPSIGKIFIEPHLKNRMGLNHTKIRFHGCGAVRHDDHIHIQL